MTPPDIRAEKPGDAAAIREVLVAAFPTQAEADLVEALRGGRDIVLSMVAEADGRVVGSIVFSRLTLNGFTTTRIVALAPIAVHPVISGDRRWPRVARVTATAISRSAAWRCLSSMAIRIITGAMAIRRRKQLRSRRLMTGQI